MGVASEKARTQAPTGEEDVGICAGEPEGQQGAIHSQTWWEAAFEKQGGLHGGGDPAGEPGRLCGSLAGGGQSRGFADQFLQRRVLPFRSQKTVHRRQFPVGQPSWEKIGRPAGGQTVKGFPLTEP